MSRKIFPRHNEVRKLRKEQGWGQDWVAQAADISTRTYQRIERGDGCSIDTLKSIASVFEVNFKSLLPPPIEESSKQDYIPSWYRLTWHLIKSFLWKPSIYTVLIISLFGTGIGLSYFLYKAELYDGVGIWEPMPMTPEREAKIKELDILIKENNHNKSKPIIRDPNKKLTEAEEFQEGLNVLLIFAMMIWIVTFMFQFLKLEYQRDYHLLINTPLERWVERKWQAISKLFTRRQSNNLA